MKTSSDNAWWQGKEAVCVCVCILSIVPGQGLGWKCFWQVHFPYSKCAYSRRVQEEAKIKACMWCTPLPFREVLLVLAVVHNKKACLHTYACALNTKRGWMDDGWASRLLWGWPHPSPSNHNRHNLSATDKNNHEITSPTLIHTHLQRAGGQTRSVGGGFNCACLLQRG
jgi:hypothetical protein